jgi:hypothetical protein
MTLDEIISCMKAKLWAIQKINRGQFGNEKFIASVYLYLAPPGFEHSLGLKLLFSSARYDKSGFAPHGARYKIALRQALPYILGANTINIWRTLH